MFKHRKMLIRFTDDYIEEINQALGLIGEIQNYLCKKEPFMGNSPQLDQLYMHSVLLSGIVDHLMYDDNSDPATNEKLLFCLRSLLNKNLCKTNRPSVIDVRNCHIDIPIEQANPSEGPIFDQGINQYNPLNP